jgi:hypothetical protein
MLRHDRDKHKRRAAPLKERKRTGNAMGAAAAFLRKLFADFSLQKTRIMLG